MARKFIILFLMVTNSFMTQSERYIKTVKLECKSNPTYFEISLCKLKPINRYKSVASIDAILNGSISNLSVRVKVFEKNDANRYVPYLVDFVIDFCKFMKESSSGVYQKVITKVLEQFTNATHPCPYTGTVSARNLYIDANMIMVPIMIKFSKVVITVFEENLKNFAGAIEFNLEYIETTTRFSG